MAHMIFVIMVAPIVAPNDPALFMEISFAGLTLCDAYEWIMDRWF